MEKKKSNKNIGYRTKNNKPILRIPEITITIIILILLCVNLVLVMKKFLIPKASQQKAVEQTKSQQQEEKRKENKTKKSSEEYQLSQLKQGTERDRIEYYCGQYFDLIENKNYEKAYELLYPEFKQKYFTTIEEFIKYVQKTYPSILAINYDDFDRQGNIYITTVIIDDALATDKTKQFSQRIVVQENNYNEYVLSFQVI